MRNAISFKKEWLIDIGLCGMLAIIASAMSLLLYPWLGDAIISLDAMDAWFNADIPRYFENLTSRWSDHYRTKVHPLFSLLVATPTIALIRLTGLSPILAVRMMMATISAAVTIVLYAIFRTFAPRVDATIYTGLFLSSADFMFWFCVPETSLMGALSILLAVFIAIIIPDRWASAVVIASAFSLSITVTNWMAGFVTAFLTQPWRKAIRLSVYAFALVAFLTPVQNFIYPKAGQFLNIKDEKKYVKTGNVRNISNTLSTFFVSSVIAPIPHLLTIERWNAEKVATVSIQQSNIFPSSTAGKVSVFGWLILLLLGLKGISSRKMPLRLSLSVGLVLLGQLALHLLYGDETFLYASHFTPLLVLLAGFASLTRARWLALGLAMLIIVAGGLNNFAMFKEASRLFISQRPAQDQIRHAKVERPNDPWPRGRGHVTLGLPGSAEKDKAYLEPGGAFSPSVGSFGIAFWVLNLNNEILTHSDALTLKDIKQKFNYDTGQIPSVISESQFYEATWTLISTGHWRLVLKPKVKNKNRLALAIRSVGPAGAPISSLHLQDNKLWINNHWRLETKPQIDLAYLGEEGAANWTKPNKPNAKDAQFPDGWGHARFWVDHDTGLTLDIFDTTNTSVLEPIFTLPIVSGLQLDLPNQQFEDALEAQVTHLMMGLVNDETRPGDPISYPLAWQRDGAYVIAALVQAGRIDVTDKLICKFAEEDFFGGFGSEADAPGLSLWAIATVADAIDDPVFNIAVWPHVVRKAEMILELLSAKQPVYKPFSGKVLPLYELDPDINRVANPADKGLIAGRMDWHSPILFINAVSYRGLMDAARLAKQKGATQQSERWEESANKLRAAWNLALTSPEQDNPRTLISGIWPTYVVADNAHFEGVLNRSWNLERTKDGGFLNQPQWTYFDLAKAHQWLYLGRPERAWATLKWFWDASPAPGLFTQWEGIGDKDAFGGWKHVRGWVDLPPITPHYWSAAEMLSLQLAMLTYYDSRPEVNTLVIGSGIPRAWFDHPMHVKGIMTAAGRIDWEWDKKTLTVHLKENGAKIQLGSQFPAHAQLKIVYFPYKTKVKK